MGVYIVKKSVMEPGKSLLIYICNFHVLSRLLFIYICKLHWNQSLATSAQSEQMGL
jgi:hypothetical protein